jgi:glycosyltransferase involved in cell wall biosynthesis/peptidoglycan/xylan/chitin deacetylase (PgdA/CDA1 family)
VSPGAELDHLPYFSLVVPTYQRRDLVCDMVRSVCAMTYAGRFEVIVVVDGSSDGTAEALSRLSCPFPLSVIQQANAGAAAARNRGARNASGDILLFLDDDMLVEPDLLAEHARSHAQGADAVLGSLIMDENSVPGLHAEAAAGWIDRLNRQGGEVTDLDVFSGHLSVRRKVFEALGGFDAAFTSDGRFAGEDTDLGVRLGARYRVVHNPLARTRHRYMVTPREWIARAFRTGRGAAAFARKHPGRVNDLFRDMGASKRVIDIVYRPLSRLPFLPRAMAWAAGCVAARIATPTKGGQRLLARAVYLAREVAYWSGFQKSLPQFFAGSAVVLSYHSIADRSGDPVLARYSVPPALLRDQLNGLLRRGYTFLSGDDFADFLSGKVEMPSKAALVTFDDCYEELLDVARQVLEPRRVPAVAFCVTGLPSNAWDISKGAEPLKLLTPEGLASLCAHGVEIGSHSRRHRPLPRLSDAELIDEVEGSAADLERIGLPRPRFFAYPYGLHEKRVRDRVRAAGYVAGFGIQAGRADRFWDRFDVPRLTITADDGPWRFWLKTSAPHLYAGLAEAGHAIRKGLAAMAARRREREPAA